MIKFAYSRQVVSTPNGNGVLRRGGMLETFQVALVYTVMP